jgi:thiopurine S-methyltransferase
VIPENPDLQAEYWNQRYLRKETGWDIGYPSPPLLEFCEKKVPRSMRILLPGGGRAYEAEYLFRQGYEHMHVIDLSEQARTEFLQRFHTFPGEQYQTGDFFQIKGQYDLVLEQTFFCALHPDQRPAYARKMNELLRPGGELAGVLFSFIKEDGPPYGGSREEYVEVFSPYFEIIKLEECYNSIHPRQSNEFFIRLRKRV